MYPWVAETFLPTFCFGDSSVSSDLSDSSSFCNGSYSSVTKMTLIVKRKTKPSLFFSQEQTDYGCRIKEL